ncbi:MAG: hypothetical protein JGK17_22425 [Microcoleus sp. PH2017_10_PVI_O_A]|uniref:hypothetical protein n=2 Tax=unclassified Microcoleus TaxID=2642155 RepID=UPI001D8CEBFF|nr:MULTISPECIES: hypothetical protein [unclassified Microcoleus]MCC3408295.1 hypothetical protein [Microcoleus sp. PH2017_10_PVI_O_A]MCC3462469.1 hypothetical protein [Microcoleus sp. PH2017_11_PCY_U_A]MCC3480838.1 hypothetical protein [Microcoleus sp. PH2017_12_PCY_D_A]MCC3561651.1 hypothetical protein [Microcoleus sp. PH2017_27_LUM_O_A]
MSDVSKYSSWTSSYTKSYFKGGYSWSETISGYDSESVNKRNVYTSNGSSWSWTRSGTVWDDGRNDWSESWSKSSWKDGKYLPSESESKRGGFDPKKTGQTNDLPKFGDVPRLNKPQKNGPVDLTKPPKKQQPQPSKELFELPIAYNPNIADKFAGNPFGATPPQSGWPPKDIGSYWLSYTGTLNTTPEKRRQIFRDIINNPSIKKVYMNVLSTQGTTFRYGDGLGNMIPGLSGQDVFAEFKDELDKYNKANPNKPRNIDVIGWFEGTGLAAPSSPMYKAAKKARYSGVPDKNAVLSYKGDGGFSYVDLLHPSVWGELQNIATDFINKYGSFVKGIIFDDRLGIPKAAEAEVATLHRSTITADKDSNDKSWIQRALTKNLTNLKKALSSTKFSISANLLRYALNDQNQDVLNWLKSGIINGQYNLQLYKNGDQYNDFVKNYQEHMAELVDKVTLDRLSISIGYIANGVNLSRDQIRQQVGYLTNTSKQPPNTKPLSPSQILGFDYRTIANIPKS